MMPHRDSPGRICAAALVHLTLPCLLAATLISTSYAHTLQPPATTNKTTDANAQHDLLTPPVEQPLHGGFTPALSPDGKKICFSYKGNLWTVSSSGGLASRLTIHVGFDGRPRWSPDGKWIAFVSNRTGNQDMFIIPSEGGSPRQVTWYGRGNIIADWSPDGQKLLFFSARDSDEFLYNAFTTPEAQTNLYTIDLHTLALQKLTFDSEPVADGAFSPNGKLLAYRRSGQPTWRPWYRGSDSAQIVVKDLAAGTVKTLLASNAQQFYPLFSADGKSLFVTTLNGGSNTPNLWRVPLAGGNPKQVTKYKTDAVRSPQIARNGSLITYLYEGDIYTVKPDGSDAKKVNILVHTDDKVNMQQRQTLTGGAITMMSPDGKLIALILKGAIWVMSSTGGEAKRLTAQDGSYDDIAWSPDSSHLAVVSDRGGQTDVYSLDVTTKALTRLTNDEAAESDTQWSPDGKYVSYTKAGPQAGLYIAPAAGGSAERRVAESGGNNTFFRGIVNHSWSPDSRWLAFSRSDKILTLDIWVVPVVGGIPVNITHYPGENIEPKFTRDGSRILFITRRNAVMQLCQVSLEKPAEPSQRRGATRRDRSSDVRIDFDGIQDRAEVVPNFTGLVDFEPTPDAQRAVVHLQNGIFLVVGLNGGQVQQVSLQPEAPETSGVTFAPDGSRFYFTGVDGTAHALPLGPFPPANSISIPFSADYVSDKQLLFQQAFLEFWRNFGAGFYDPGMHGVNWKALRDKYESLLPGIATPEEFTAILSNMVGEVNSSHSEVSAGSGVPPGPAQPTLGLVYDYAYSGPGLKVSAVMPDGPTDQPGAHLHQGDYILSIDGVEVLNNEAYYQTIQNKQGKPVDLLVNSKPSKDGARSIKVRPISAVKYEDLDYEARVKHTREQVSKLSSGKFAYIHIREMSAQSLVRFDRELWGDAYLKDGLVLDIRGNGGGNTHDAILQELSQHVYGYTRQRDSITETQPERIWTKPIVLLINENSFSDAEVFPQGFRSLHLGKIVGVPTPGYVIGVREATLLDGTHYRIPTSAFYTIDGRNMENLGIEPDINVINSPEDTALHKDRQLEAAIEVLLNQVAGQSTVPAPLPVFHTANDNPNGGSSASGSEKR